MSGSADTGLHFVQQKELLLLFASLLQAFQKGGVGGNDSPLPLHRLHQNRTALFQSLERLFQVVEFHKLKARHHRSEPLMILRCAGG